MDKHYIPKLTVEIDEEEYFRLRNRLNYGELKPLMAAIITDINNLMDEYGDLVIALIAGKQVLPREVLPSISKAVDVCDRIRKDNDNG